MCYLVGKENKRMKKRTIFTALRNNAAAGYQSPVKEGFLKGADLLVMLRFQPFNYW